MAASDAVSPPSPAAALLRPALRAFAPAPPAMPPEAPLSDALAAMEADRASAVLAVDAGGRPVGILTEQDVARRVAFRLPPDAPLSAAMTAPVIACAAEEGLWRAIALLRAHRLRHLPLLDAAGRCAGLLHRADALAAASGSMLAHLDALAGDEAAVKRAQAGLATSLLAEGLDAVEVVGLVSGINADLHRRILARTLEGEAPVPFTLLLMGSLGRGESLLRPDQDNGLILADYPDEEHGRIDAWFRAFSERFCRALDEAGFPLCKGGIMATSPLWRKTRSQWRDQLRLWARRRSGAALLFADILFDLRAGWGDPEAAGALRAEAMALLAAEPAWAAMLAAQDARLGVGLTFWGGFADDEPGPGRRTDLKLHGLMPLVAAARLQALRVGVAEVSTPARLAALEERGLLSRGDGKRLREGFAALLDAVLRQQLADQAEGRPPGNLVDTAVLPAERRAALKDALRAVRSFARAAEAELTGRLW
jgi:signal-transduction protein with cAMP-binding, CBS, and nucleotidyltransferase domain